MSGEATVTEGHTLTGTTDPLTYTEYNQAAKPTVQVDASSITSREVAPGTECLLVKVPGVDMNSTSDQQVDMPSGDYVLTDIMVTNASINLTTAAGGVFTGSSKSGTTIVDTTQAYSTLSSSSKYLDLTLAVTADVLSSDPIYISLTTAQGAAATADFYFYGRYLK